MLRPHADHIGAALRGTVPEGEGESCLAPDWPVRPEGCEFVVGPVGISVRLGEARGVDALCWVGAHEALVNRELHQVANGFAPITGSVRLQRAEHLPNEFSRHPGEREIAVLITEPFPHRLRHYLRSGCELAELMRDVIGRDSGTHGTRLAALGADLYGRIS